MKHPALLFVAVLVAVLAVLVVSISAFPARTVSQVNLAWNDTQPQTLESAGVHSMVGASFHSVSAGF